MDSSTTFVGSGNGCHRSMSLSKHVATSSLYKLACLCWIYTTNSQRAIDKMQDVDKWEGSGLISGWCVAENGSTAVDVCMSCCFPCHTYASIQKKHDPTSTFCLDFSIFCMVEYIGAGCCLICATRSKINPHEPCCNNCLASMLCPACSLIQAMKTAKPMQSPGQMQNNAEAQSSDPLLDNHM